MWSCASIWHSQAAEICLVPGYGGDNISSAPGTNVQRSAFQACEIHAVAWESALMARSEPDMDWTVPLEQSHKRVDESIRYALYCMRMNHDQGLAVLLDSDYYTSKSALA